MEVTATRTGDYVVSYSGDLPSLPARVVLDDGYRYPNHPKLGMRKPPASGNDGCPTDPAVLAEEQLGVRLPEDLRALYRTIHDDNGESGLLGRFSPAPLEQVLTLYHDGDPGSPPYAWDDGLFWDEGLFAYDPVVFETHPYGHVRRLSRNDWWVTFAPDYGGNDAAVDLDPAALGTYGQLLMHGRDVYGPIVYVAASVRHRMRTVLAAMRGAQPGDEEWAWDVGEWSTPGHQWQWLVDLGDAVLVDMVAAVPESSVIQRAHLRQVEQVRLGDLAGCSHLRSIRVPDAQQTAEYVDLSLPPGLPVEQVHIVAGRFEPHRLAATPTLTYVTLGGNTEPISVAALAGLPNLVRLDLAEAAVADVGSIATFPALRVLSLNAQQWDELLGIGWTPSRLAAAEVGGRVEPGRGGRMADRNPRPRSSGSTAPHDPGPALTGRPPRVLPRKLPSRQEQAAQQVARACVNVSRSHRRSACPNSALTELFHGGEAGKRRTSLRLRGGEP